MQKILVKIHDAKQTIAETLVVTKDGAPTVIKASKRVNYEFIDQATGYAPHHIVTKRVGQDLHISLEEDAQATDLIIEGFYDAGDTALIGMAENNQYYYYIPDTGSMADYVTELAIGDIEGQALGGTAYPTPWWLGASDVNAAFVPWLVGLAGIGAAIAFGRDGKAKPAPVVDTIAPEAPVVKAMATEVTVTPASDAVSMEVTYKDRTNQDVTKTFSKDPQTGKWKDNDPNDAITIDENTGKVTIPVAVVAEKTPVTATSKDNAGNPSEKGEATTLDIPPSAPTVTADNVGDGKIDLPKDLEVGDKVIVNVPLKDGTTETVTLTKQQDGSLTSDKPAIIPNVPAGQTSITIPATELKDGGTLTATSTTADGKIGGKGEVILKDTVPEPTISVNADGISITPENKKYPTPDSPDKISGKYVNANGDTVVFEFTKDPVTDKWVDNNPSDTITINEDTGVVTIPSSELKPGSPAEAIQSFGKEESSPATAIAPNVLSASSAPKPNVDAQPDGSVIIEKTVDNATELTASYKDETGADKTVIVSKDPSTGKWVQDPSKPINDKVSVDETTGKITIPANEVKDGSLVTGTQAVPNAPQKGEDTTVVNNETGTLPVAPSPVVTNNNDGSVSVAPTTNDTPSKNATSATATYTDEAGNPQTVTATKDPVTGKWTKDPANTNDKVTVNPDTGVITIPADQVKDGSEVKGTQSTPIGDGVATSIAKDNIPEPTVKANDDGSATITPTKDATSLTVEFVDENNTLNTIKAEKQGDKWVIADPSNTPDIKINETTGEVSIPADKLKDGSEVVANQTTPQGVSGDATDRVKAFDNTDKPTVTVTPPTGQDNDSDITAKPGEDNTKVTVTFTDEDGKPQTIVTEKDPTTGEWKPTTDSTVPVSTTPTTDGKTPYIDPKTGEVTLPKDSVDNDKPVKVVGEKTGADPVTVEVKPADTPTITEKSKDPTDNDGDITAKPGDDNTKATVTFTDEDGKPQTITVTKGDHDNDPSTPDTWAVDPTKTTVVPVETTPTTDGKTPYIDPKTGEVTLPKDSVDNDKPVKVVGEKEDSTPSVEQTNPTPPPADTTAPTLTKSEVPATGDKIELTFDEPLDPNNPPKATDFTVTVDGKPVEPTDVKVEGDKVTLTLPTPVKQGEPVTVAYTDPTTGDDTNAIQDTSGNDAADIPATPVTNNSTVPTPPPADTTAPTLTKSEVPATGDKIELTFDEPLDPNNPPKATDFTVTVDGKPVEPTDVKVEGDKVTLTLPTPVKQGEPVTVAYTDPTTGDDTNAIQDTSGNDAADIPATPVTNNSTVPTPPPADTTAPTLTKSEVPATGDKIELTFDEPLDPNNPPKATDFTVTVDGKPVEPTDVKVEGDKVTLTLPTPVKQGEPVTVAYTDPTTGDDTNAIQDTSGNDAADIPATPVTNNSTVPTPPPADTTAPTLTKSEVPATGDKIELTFDEPLDPNNPPKATDFTVTVDGKPVEPTDVKVEGDKVTLTLPTPVKQGEPVTVAYTDPTTGDDTNAIQDTSGNDAADIPATPVTNNSTVPTPPPADTTAPTLTKSEVPATGDKIELTFDEPLDPNNPPKATDFTVTVDGKPVEPTDVKVEGDKVTLTLPTPVKQGEPVTVAYTDPTTGDDTNAIQDTSGNDAADIPATPVTNNSTVPTPPPADTTAPTLTKSEVPATGDKIELTFDEPLDPNNPPKATDFTVTVDGKPVEPTDVKVEGDKVTLTLPTPVKQGEPVTVAYTDPTTGDDTNAIQDTSGNDAADIPATPVTNNSTVPTPPPADTTAPTLTKSEVPATGDKIELTFDEPLDPNNPPKATDFTVTVDGKPVEPTDVKVEGDKVTLTLPTPVKQGEPVTVAYTDPTTGDDTNAIQDTSGNDAADIPATPVTNNSTVPTPPPADTTAPTLTKSEVPATGDKIELTFDEPLDPNNPPKATDFTVTVDGKPVEPTDVKVEGDKVTLTLPTPVKQGEPVTVAYTDPTTGDDTNAIQDTSGNDAADIPATPVTNNSTVPTPPPADTTAPTLTKSEVPATGDKIELTFDEPLDPNNPPKATDFTVTVDGKPVEPTDVKVEGDKVTLTLPTPVKQGEPVTVAYTDPTTGDDTNAIQDTSGNDAADIPATPVTNNSTVPTPPPADTTAPTIIVNIADTEVEAGATTTVTFTLADDKATEITDFIESDITVTNGTLVAGSLKQDPNNKLVYTAEVTAGTDTTKPLTVTVAENKFSDGTNTNAEKGEDTAVIKTPTPAEISISATGDQESGGMPATAENNSNPDALLTYTVSLNKAVATETSYVITLSGKATADDYNVDVSKMPAGATYNRSNNTISFTIPANTKEDYSFTIDPIHEPNANTEMAEGNELVIATITTKPDTVNAAGTLDGTGKPVATGMILDSNPIAFRNLTGDYNLVVGPSGGTNGAGTTNNAEQYKVEDGGMTTSDFDDTFYIGYAQDGTRKGTGNISNAFANSSNGLLADNNRSITTVDFAKGNDTVKLSGGISANTRIYLGEGNDTIETTNEMNANSILFAESGDDTINIGGGLLALAGSPSVYAGSGSDTVTLSRMTGGTILDLGSGNPMPPEYLSHYQGNGYQNLSLGNDDNTDLATDVNTVTINGNMAGTILGGAGSDNITIGGILSGKIEAGTGNDSLTVKGGSTIKLSDVIGFEHMDITEGNSWIQGVTVENLAKGDVKTMTIDGDARDRVYIGTRDTANNLEDNSAGSAGSWVKDASSDTVYDIYTNGDYTLKIDKDIVIW